jgi:lactate dehydrogenase-like 2-hydroxyacid dehydrogenase
VLTDSVAEHAIALMMSVARRVTEGDRYTRAGKYKGWGPMLLLGRPMIGKKLAIIGLGRIGSRVAEIAHNGYGMEIHYYDIAQNADFEKSVNATFHADVDSALKIADYVSVHVPLLPATQHLINADRLREMNSEAFLVNTSRGPVVDEAALVDALKNGVIAGAALDVFEKEPELAPGLAELENVVLTPHIASGTIETRSAMAELAAKNIIAVLSGEAPLTPVTK